MSAGESAAPTGGIRVIPLGGVGEIGKNMTAIESDAGIVLIDAGLAFPRDEMLGVDLVIPDLAYLRANRARVRAVILTHGHEDHVGSLPYVVREVGVKEIWATRLTLGLVKSKLDEHGLIRQVTFHEISPEDDEADIGPFTCTFFRVTHSIPDAIGIAVHTPHGTIVHTGDFKLDHTPRDGKRTDLARIAELGDEGIAVLLGDSTNAERPGVTPSEATVSEALQRAIREAPGRVIVTCFSSHVHRAQEVVDAAAAAGKRVCIVGRSMNKIFNIARNLGYATAPDGLFVRPSELDELPDAQVVILCTGSQGEPLSALTRIANGRHPQVGIRPGDTVIFSAKPVPGNELAVHGTMNHLWLAGAVVLHQESAQVHVSGHGSAEELKTMLALARPRHFVPVHGEHRHLLAHARLAEQMGVPRERIHIPEIGGVLVLEHGELRRGGHVESGVAFVDGLGIGDVQDVVLRDRRQLSADGVLIIVCQQHEADGEAPHPEIVARGFAPEGDEASDLLAEVERRVAAVLEASRDAELRLLQSAIHDAVAELVYDRSGKRPLVLPVVVEV